MGVARADGRGDQLVGVDASAVLLTRAHAGRRRRHDRAQSATKLVTTSGYVGDQAGVSDTGNRDVLCANKISGAGYSPLDRTSSLPNPPAPAWVRPIDVFSYAAAIHPRVDGNRYGGRPYNP